MKKRDLGIWDVTPLLVSGLAGVVGCGQSFC